MRKFSANKLLANFRDNFEYLLGLNEPEEKKMNTDSRYFPRVCVCVCMVSGVRAMRILCLKYFE